jgi:hypothetical protein
MLICQIIESLMICQISDSRAASTDKAAQCAAAV